ncbi:hypothetical protein AB1N83_013571 [Pleurotus pulmonarius]
MPQKQHRSHSPLTSRLMYDSRTWRHIIESTFINLLHFCSDGDHLMGIMVEKLVVILWFRLRLLTPRCWYKGQCLKDTGICNPCPSSSFLAMVGLQVVPDEALLPPSPMTVAIQIVNCVGVSAIAFILWDICVTMDQERAMDAHENSVLYLPLSPGHSYGIDTAGRRTETS